MTTIEVSTKAEWKFFEQVVQALKEGLGGCWKTRLDGLEQRYTE